MKAKTLETRNGINLRRVSQVWDDEAEGMKIDEIQTDIDWVGPEPTNAPLDIHKALEIAFGNQGQYERTDQAAIRAVAIMVLDHNIRTLGQTITSQYDGADAITGQKFEAGTEIIWDRQHGTVIA